MILLANRSNVSWNLNFSSTEIWSFYPILSCNFETCELPRGFSRNPCTRRSDGKICRSSLLPWDLAQPPLDRTFLFSCSVNQEAESTPKIGKKQENGRTFSLGLTSVQYCVHATLQVWHPGWDMVRQGYTSEKTAVNASKPSKWFCNSVEIKHDKTNINKELHCDHCVFLAATLNTLLSDTHRRWRSGPWTVKGKQEVVSNYLLMMCLQNFIAAYSCQPLCKTPRE